MTEKKRALTAATVQSAKTINYNQDTAKAGKTQDLDVQLSREMWNCALGILNGCGGDIVEARQEVSRLIRLAPIEPRLKKPMRKLLRTALYYQVARNLRIPINTAKEVSA